MSKRSLDVDGTRNRLNALGLAYAAEQLEPVLSEAVKQGHAPHLVLDQLLDLEHQAREGRRVRTSLGLSSLPTNSTLAVLPSSRQSSGRGSRPWRPAPGSAAPRPC